jgi:hypothetical protein
MLMIFQILDIIIKDIGGLLVVFLLFEVSLKVAP